MRKVTTTPSGPQVVSSCAMSMPTIRTIVLRSNESDTAWNHELLLTTP